MVSRCHSVEDLKTSTDRLSLTLVSSPASQQQQESTTADGSSLADAPASEPDPRSLLPSLTRLSLADPVTCNQRSDRDDLRGRGPRKNLIRSDNALASYKRLTSPDRFLPDRQSPPAIAETFRLSQNPDLLSPSERVHRRRDPEHDPFVTTGRISSVDAPRLVLDRSLTPRHLPRHVGQTVLHMGSTLEPTWRITQQTSGNAGWDIGEYNARVADPSASIPDGQGRLLGSGTLAPMHITKFPARKASEELMQAHQSRIALALDIDQASRALKFCDSSPPSSPTSSSGSPLRETTSPEWKDCAWVRGEDAKVSKQSPSKSKRAIPSTPFRVLDAPLLRDDYYCSTLAYCSTARTLAVGLGSRVYIWSERAGVRHPPLPVHQSSNFVTSLSFSSCQGGRSILAVGRNGGEVTLWSMSDSNSRFEICLPNAVSCVVFKHTTTRRNSERFHGLLADNEDLVVGDDSGTVWYYSIEWADRKLRSWSGWKGSMTLLAKIAAHTQQVCGMTWSPDGAYLTTGGNDNSCLIFHIAEILGEKRFHSTGSIPKSARVQTPDRGRQLRRSDSLPPRSQNSLNRDPSREAPSPSVFIRSRSLKPTRTRTLVVPFGSEKHKFPHAAAVKALAYAPWQPSLLATGGGSNDRCIRFYHAPSGSCLAIINVQAQVTSLIWSKTRREIAATFGYTQPAHPFRIAVFAWPSCQQVVAIPWGLNNDGTGYEDCGRALWAISYPGGPNDRQYRDTTGHRSHSSTSSATSTAGNASEVHSANESPEGELSNSRNHVSYREGGRWWPRTGEEGCIIVASSDESVKFHEVWRGERKTVTGTSGLLGGSDILETLEGIENEGNEVIR